jgi:hypothetical protein
VHEVSRHLHHFYIKCGIYQLTDREYDMNMPTFCNNSVTVLLIKLLRCIIRHCTLVRAVRMAMGILCKIRIMVKSVCYMGALDPLIL